MKMYKPRVWTYLLALADGHEKRHANGCFLYESREFVNRKPDLRELIADGIIEIKDALVGPLAMKTGEVFVGLTPKGVEYINIIKMGE